jgi:hypothetical protein
MSVSQAQSCINSAEFSEWMAYNTINPFTVDRTEAMLSVACSILANTSRKKGSKAYKPADFIPKYGRKKVMKPTDLETKMRALFNGNN